MAQTQGAVACVDAKVEFSTNGSSWTDISGSSNSVDPGTQTRQNGETYTFQGDTAILTAGKREPLEITVRAVYTETAGEAYALMRAAFEAAGSVGYIRYSPRGGATGQDVYTSPAGIITELPYPMADATDADPKLMEVTVRVPYLTKSVAA